MVVAAAYKVQVRCTGRLKNGEVCNRLLLVGEVERFDGWLELFCEKCRTRTIFNDFGRKMQP